MQQDIANFSLQYTIPHLRNMYGHIIRSHKIDAFLRSSCAHSLSFPHYKTSGYEHKTSCSHTDVHVHTTTNLMHMHVLHVFW